MGKQKLCLGLIIGSIAGGLLSLLDRDARSYAKAKISGSSYYVKRPSEAVKGAKNAFDRFNTQFTTSADNAINALEQVENTIDQFTKNEDREKLNHNL